MFAALNTAIKPSANPVTAASAPAPARQANAVSLTLILLMLGLAALSAIVGTVSFGLTDTGAGALVTAFTFIGPYFLFALKIANQWEKAVVLRFGKFRGLYGPGLFWIVPILDSVSSWIDHRSIFTPFAAQKVLTRDTVPVDVDAVLLRKRARSSSCPPRRLIR
jgi:hypothetical protein